MGPSEGWVNPRDSFLNDIGPGMRPVEHMMDSEANGGHRRFQVIFNLPSVFKSKPDGGEDRGVIQFARVCGERSGPHGAHDSEELIAVRNSDSRNVLRESGD